MSDAERQGQGIINRIVDRLSRLRVSRPESEQDAGSSIIGIVGTVHGRAAAWEKVHGRDWQVEAWENPRRAARYLATGWCEAHSEPQQH